MQDLSLSLLSRGCARFVSSNRNTGRHDGRLDVCFTPEDYYIWKSQDSLLRLSNSGHLLAEAESALPKTFSTRRGPLLLYSQDLVTFEASCSSDTRDKKRQVVQQYTQQVAQPLSTVKELSAAILSYNTQFHSSSLGPLYPPLHPHLAPDLLRPNSLPFRTTQECHSPELIAHAKSQTFPADRGTVQLENQPQEEGQRIRLDLFLQLPCTPRTPTPQMEPRHWVHYVTVTPEEPEEPQPTERSTHAAVKHHRKRAELHPPVKNWVHNVEEDQGCSIQDGGMTGDKGNYENSQSGSAHGRRDLLPPLTVGHSVSNGPCWEKTNRPRWESPSSDEHHAWHLPPIAESSTVAPGRVVQAQSQQEAHPKAERDVFQSQKMHNHLRQQPVLLPLLFPEKEGGVLGGVAGRKGKQSSLAFLQNRLLDLQDPCESSGANRGVVRGVLPLELRDLQNGKYAGSLIMGPDGEIIQLSLYDTSSQEPCLADSDPQEQALQVLSAEGETLPWVIVLQPEHTHSEGEVEDDVPVVDIKHHQSSRQLTETNACSPSSHTHSVPATMTKTTTKDSDEDILGEDDKISSRMLLLREQTGKEEPRGGSTEAVEEKDEKEMSRTGQTSYLSALHQPGEGRNMSPKEAEDTVDKRRKNIKRKDAEKASTSTGKREMETAKSAAPHVEKASKTKTEGRQKTKSQTALLPLKNRMTEREGEREMKKTEERGEREVKMNEERGEREEVMKQMEESAGRKKRRRGKLKHKELVVGNHENSSAKADVEAKPEVSVKKRSATQRHNKKTNAEKESEHLSTNADKHNGVRSASSLRSTAASSQVNQKSSKKSIATPSEEAVLPGNVGPASSRGRLSSCSTVKMTEDQLILNPVKPEFFKERTQKEKEEAAALHLAQRAERRRQEVERKRREREEEERKLQEREQTEERMKSELEEERRKRTEELRLKKLEEEEERRKHEEEELKRARQEQAQREREKRRQEERRRQVERLQRMREEEEHRRQVELERLRLESLRRQEEESRKLQEMDEGERMEYLCRKEQEEENRRKEEEERKSREEEAALQAAEEAKLQAELLARQMVQMQQQLAFKRGLVLEAGGLEKTQGISRPWIYSYFTLLQLLGLSPPDTVTTAPDR